MSLRNFRIFLSAIVVASLAGVSHGIAASDDAATGRELVSLIPSDPIGFEPQDPCDQVLCYDLYSQLIGYKVDYDHGSFFENQYVPEAAESWEVAPDSHSVTFHIRKDATFWDGSPLTAEDVYWSFERSLVGKVGGGRFQLSIGAILSMDQVELVDKYTIRFNFPNGMNRFSMKTFAQREGSILSKAYGTAHATSSDPYATQTYVNQPMGSGPYKFVSWTHDQSVVFEAWKDYWGDPKPYFKGITFRIVPDSHTRALAVASGDADIARGLPPRELAALKSNPDVRVVSVPKFQDVVALRMNPTVPPFDDPNIRKAIIKAIPYDAIAQDVLMGYGTRSKNLIGVDSYGYKELPVFETDLEEAKSLVQASKYAGKNIEFTLWMPSEAVEDNDAAVLIQDNLNQIGIHMNIKKIVNATYVDRAIKKDEQNMPIEIRGMGPVFRDALYYAYWMWNSNSPTNYVNYKNPAIDQETTDALAVLPEDTAAYDSLLGKVFDDTLVADSIAAPLYQKNWSHVVRSDIQNLIYLGGNGFETVYLRSSK